MGANLRQNSHELIPLLGVLEGGLVQFVEDLDPRLRLALRLERVADVVVAERAEERLRAVGAVRRRVQRRRRRVLVELNEGRGARGLWSGARVRARGSEHVLEELQQRRRAAIGELVSQLVGSVAERPKSS